MVERAHPATGNDGDPAGVNHGARQLKVEALPRAVAVHRVEHHLAGAEGLAFRGPGHGVESGGLAAPVGEDGPAALDPADVDADHDTLGAEGVGQLGDQLGAGHRGGVDPDLVGAHPQEAASVRQRPHAPADHEGDEELLGGTGYQFDHGLAPARGGGDVVEHNLVGALGVVLRRQLYRVTGVAEVLELDPLDHPAAVHVEAGDDPDRPHRATGPTRTARRPASKSTLRS